MPDRNVKLVATYRSENSENMVTLVIDDGTGNLDSFEVERGTKIYIHAENRKSEGYLYRIWRIFEFDPASGALGIVGKKDDPAGPGYVEDPYATETYAVNVLDAFVTAEYVNASTAVLLTMQNPDKGGTLMPGAGRTVALEAGDTIEIEAFANYGSTFAGWTTEGDVVLDDPSSSFATATVGSDATVTAAFILFGMTRGTLFEMTGSAEFQSPVVFAEYTCKGKIHTTRCRVPKNYVAGNELLALLKKRIALYTRSDAIRALRNGSANADMGDPIDARVTVTDRKSGATGDANKRILGPRITSVQDESGNPLDSLEGMDGQLVRVIGRYYGGRRVTDSIAVPTCYVLVQGANETARFVRCRYDKASLVYPDWQGKPNRSPMDPESGDSLMVVRLPNLKPGESFGNRFALDNRSGLAVFTLGLE
jgi:hypothetical protein